MFAITIEAIAFFYLWATVNLLSAALALAACTPHERERDREPEVMGKMEVIDHAPDPEPIQGEIAVPEPEPDPIHVKGEIAVPEPEPEPKPKPQPEPEDVWMGDIEVLDDPSSPTDPRDERDQPCDTKPAAAKPGQMVQL